WVSLGTWVGAPHDDVAAFSDALRATHGDALPGDKFVMRRRDDTALDVFYDERETDGWRRAVDNVRAMSAATTEDAYGGSVFFRVAGLRTDGELHVARREPLVRGERASLLLEFHNPHLTASARAALSLNVVADSSELKATAQQDVPAAGIVEVALVARGEAPGLVVRVEPNASQHTSLAVRFPRARLFDAAPPSAPADRAALLRLYDVVRRVTKGDAAGELAVLDALVPLMPDETRVAERRAVLLAATGADDVAFDVLRQLDDGALDDAARMLYFRLLALRGAVAPAVTLVADVDLREGGRRTLLLNQLDAIEPPLLDRVVRELSVQLADNDDLLSVLDHTADRLRSPELIAETARSLFMATGDAQRAADFVMARRSALRLVQKEIADVLLELVEAGAEVDDLEDVVGHRIANLIARGDIEDALSRLRRATPSLRRSERDRLYHRTADRLHDLQRDDEAAALMIELVHAALITGDLDSASEACDRAAGLYAIAGDAPGELKQAIARVNRAWSEVEELADWRTSDRERRTALLRTALLNKRILIVGGLKREGHEESLRELTGAEVEWGERFRTEGDSLEALAQRIRSRRYALVVFRWQFSGHEVSEKLKGECTAAGVPWAYATSGGVRGLEEAVYGAIDTG
ncbi:MAG TPA: hypothetical protein VK928_09580, partial [Longimicrobiales bacterium]|nr:hypothetical protein [Longimicrobiales bacterium]